MKRFYGGIVVACVAIAGVALAQETESPRDPDSPRSSPSRGAESRNPDSRNPESRGFRGRPMQDERTTPRRASSFDGLLGGGNRAEHAEPGPAGKVVSFDLVILEANKAGKQKPSVDLSNAQKIPELLRALEEKGEASVISRVRLSSLEQQVCSVQVGESRPVATGRSSPFGGGRDGRGPQGAISYQMTNVGMLVQIKSRVEDDGSVIAELQLSSSRLAPAAKAEGDEEFAPNRTTTLSSQSTVRIPKGRGVIVSASQESGADESRETLVLVSATVESSPASATSAEGEAAKADAERVLQVYSLKNASADQTAKLLLAIADFPLQATADARTNSLVVRTTATNRDEVTALIQRLDSDDEKSPPK